MTASSLAAASAGVWIARPAFTNGAESGVATVPGCRATQIASLWLRLSSIDAVRTNWFKAAFDARYAYQPVNQHAILTRFGVARCLRKNVTRWGRCLT